MGKQLSIIKEISPEDLWYAENEVTVRNGLEHFFTDPFPKFQHSFLMTRWRGFLLPLTPIAAP